MEEVIIIVICLILNALLAAFETAFVSISRGQLKHAARRGSKDAQWILKRRESPERTLSVIQIGISLVGAMAAAVGGVGAAESIQPYIMNKWGMSETPAEIIAVIFIVIPLTYLTVVFGEITPKSLALRAPMPIVLKGAKWLSVMDRLFSPVVSLLTWSTRSILTVFFRNSRQSTSPPPSTTVEIDALAPSHQQAVLNFAHIEGRKCRDFLVPWSTVTYVRSEEQLEDIVSVVFASGHTRLPVTSSKNGDVIGILHTKEFLAYRENKGTDWLSIIRPVLKVKSTDTALSILRKMQTKRSHMAIVFSNEDEYIGIVTMEDILEEFLGEIYDEDENSRIRKIFADRVKSKAISFKS